MLNGAYFTPSGAGASASYARASSLGAKSSAMVGAITSSAGPLACRRSRTCQYSQLHSIIYTDLPKESVPLFPFCLFHCQISILTTKKHYSIVLPNQSYIPLFVNQSINPSIRFLLASVHFLHCQFISSCLKALCNLGLISIQEKPMSVLEAGAEVLSMPNFLFFFFFNLKSAQLSHPLVSSNHHPLFNPHSIFVMLS